jgi:mRNA interferase MazF
MARFVKGDVVVLPFPFSDLSANKKRPALVIASPQTYDDLILCMITSTSAKDGSAIPLTADDFDDGRLPHDSNIRPNRLFTADATIILSAAGRLSADKVQEVVAEITRIISA